MVEEIEEHLQEYVKNCYDNINVNVEYESIRKYKIIILLKNPKIKGIIKINITFYYDWQQHLTFSANLEQIKYYINKYIKEVIK